MKEYTKEPRKPSEAAQESLPEDMIEGRNAVTEALRSGRTINKVFLADGDTDRALGRLAAMAKESGAVVVRVDRRKLNDMSPTGAHQGIMAAVAAHDYATVDDMLNAAQEKGEAPLLVICDELSDPHNLGAIIRTAECAGAHGVIIPERRAVGLTPAAVKATWAALRASSPRELPAPTTTGSPVRPRTTIRPPCLPPTSRPATLETWMTKSRSKARTNNFFSQAAFPPCQAVFFMAGIPAEAKHRPGARRRSTAVP